MPENATLGDEISQEERLDSTQREEREKRRSGEKMWVKCERDRKGEKKRKGYIKAISGPGVCGALVTVPTPLITFREAARREKMKKAQARGNEETRSSARHADDFHERVRGRAVVSSE